MREVGWLVVLALVLGLQTTFATSLGLGYNKLVGVAFEKVSKKNVNSLDQLMIDIGRPLLKRPQHKQAHKPNERVIDHLAKLKDKDAKIPPSSYSAKELLALNEIRRGDFKPEELERRRSICASLEPASEEKKRLDDISPSVYTSNELQNLWSLEERKIFLKRNLFKYCQATLKEFEWAYRNELHSKTYHQLTTKDHVNLGELAKIYKDFEVNQRMHGHNPSERQDHFREFVQDRDAKEMAKIRETCKKLLDLIEALPLELFETSRLASDSKNCKKLS